MNKLRKKNLKIILFFLASMPLTFSSAIKAENIHPDAGSTGATFLKLAPGASPIALGESYSAVTKDSLGLYYNPAGIADFDKKDISFSHNELYEGLRHDFLGYINPFDNYVLGFGVTVFNVKDDIESRTGAGEDDIYDPITLPAGYYGANAFCLTGSYARTITEKISAGVSLKLVKEAIEWENTYSVAADLGCVWKIRSSEEYEHPLTAGFSIRNIGPGIKYLEKSFSLPLSANAGINYLLSEKIQLLFDLNQYTDDYLNISGGFQYSPIKLITLRAGTKYRLYDNPSKGLAFGVGLNYNDLRFDYSMKPFNTFGVTHHISLAMRYDKPVSEAEKQQVNMEKTEQPFVSSAGVIVETITSGAGNKNRQYRVEYSKDDLRIYFRTPRGTDRNITIEVLTDTGMQEFGDVLVFKSFEIKSNLKKFPANTVYEFNVSKEWMETNSVSISTIRIYDKETRKFIDWDINIITDDPDLYRIRVDNLPSMNFAVVFKR
ncbi:MAG: hypothetical protein A2252_10785 [Elusimicrobia bacterium RIFOXYA2_FULL_39_19]|nr:MAG: hypothetical protein A2252_10785 [Elusimicrobia bacterium RIFOXYA2_FULL_39_19]